MNFLRAHKTLLLSLGFLVLFSVTVSYATPPAQPFNPGQTLDPHCAPGETNCTVVQNTISITGNAALGSATVGPAVLFPYQSYKAIGDSITFGQQASSPSKNWVNQLGTHIGLVADNKGVGGDQAADQQQYVYPTIVTNNGNQLFTLALGSNDVTNYGTNADMQANFKAIMMANAAFLAIPEINKVRGQSADAHYTGTWANSTYYGGTIGKYSSTNGDTVTVTTQGTVAYVAYTLLDGNAGTANVTVDGGSPIAISSFGQNGTAISTINGKTYGSALLRVAGLSNTTHTVVITVTSATGAGSKVFFDWAAGNANIYPSAGRPTVLHANIPQRLNQAAVSPDNIMLADNISKLQSDGLNIYPVDIENVLNLKTNIGPDGSHPNDAGYYVLYTQYRAVLDTINNTPGSLNVNGNSSINGNIASSGGIISQGTLQANTINSFTAGAGIAFQSWNNFTTSGTAVNFDNHNVTNSTGNYYGVSITPTYIQTGTAGATDLLINRTQTAIGTGVQRLFDAQSGGSSRFFIDTGGNTSVLGHLVVGSNSLSPDALLYVSAVSATTSTTSNAFGTAGMGLRVASTTYISTAAGGTSANASGNSFSPVMFAATNPTTITTAANVYITSGPTAGANVTVTNSYALFVNSGFSAFLGGIQSGLIASTSNFYAVGGSDLSTAGRSGLTANLFAGASGVTFRALFSGNGGSQLTANDSYSNVIVGSSPITTAATGTHTMLANFVVNPIGTVTNGGATTTNTASLYIRGAATGGTNNLALYSATGSNYFGGNVGIGIVSPQAPLHTAGGSPGTNTTGIMLQNSGGTAAGTAVSIDFTSTTGLVGQAALGRIATIRTNRAVSGDSDLVFSTFTNGGLTEKMHIMDNGAVGIGQAAPSFLLHVGSSTPVGIVARFQNSTGTCDINPTTTALSCSSDMNLKKNIDLLSDGSAWSFSNNISADNQSILSKLLVLTPVNYNWNSESDIDTKHTGFIAQDVRQVFPDLVTEDASTHLLSLNYMGLIPYTVEAIKEMDLNIKNIADLNRPNTWRDSLTAWFASTSNGIQNIFAVQVTSKKSVTSELCVEDVCVTKDQFLHMVQNNGSTTVQSAPSQPQEEVVEEPPAQQTPAVQEPEVSAPEPDPVEPVIETAN